MMFETVIASTLCAAFLSPGKGWSSSEEEIAIVKYAPETEGFHYDPEQNLNREFDALMDLVSDKDPEDYVSLDSMMLAYRFLAHARHEPGYFLPSIFPSSGAKVEVAFQKNGRRLSVFFDGDAKVRAVLYDVETDTLDGKDLAPIPTALDPYLAWVVQSSKQWTSAPDSENALCSV